MPFMDYRLVEFLASVPACYKIHNGWTKYLARLAFDEKLPKEICWRKDKMGWPIPEEYWFHDGLRDWITQSVTESSLLRKMGRDQMAKEWLNSKRDVRKAVRYLNVAQWGRTFGEGS
jgi:asparagine synthase (glutamine-hydrolysing)